MKYMNIAGNSFGAGFSFNGIEVGPCKWEGDRSVQVLWEPETGRFWLSDSKTKTLTNIPQNSVLVDLLQKTIVKKCMRNSHKTGEVRAMPEAF